MSFFHLRPENMISVLLLVILMIGMIASKMVVTGPLILLGGVAVFFLTAGLSGRYERTARGFSAVKMPAIMILAFLALGWLGLLWSYDATQTLERAAKLMLAIPICLACIAAIHAFMVPFTHTYTTPPLPRYLDERAFAVLLYGVILVAILLVIEIIAGYPFHYWKHITFSEGNFTPSSANRITNLALLYAIPLMAFCLYRRKTVFLFAGPGLLTLLVVIATMTESQSFVFSLGIAIVVFALSLSKPVLVAKIFTVLAVTGILVMPWLVPFIYAAVPDISGYLSEGYVNQRLEIWLGTARLIQDAPLAGYGLETFRDHPLPVPHTYLDTDTMLHPHNAYLQIWYETGLTGALILCSFVAWIFQQVRKMHNRILQAAALSQICAVMFIAGVSWGIWQGWWLAGMTLAAIVVIFVDKMAAAVPAIEERPTDRGDRIAPVEGAYE